MDDPNALDWALVRSFLAVAETGSLSEAGRRLGLSQPTVGRQMRQLETDLDVTLFTRQPRGLALTEAGQALIPHARMMREAAQALGLSAAGRSERLAGPVRITSSVATAQYHLPSILAALRLAEPEITIDLVPTDHSENLLYREADLALRHYRSEQLDIVMRYLGDLELGLYATQDLIDRQGMPDLRDAVPSIDLVGLDRDDVVIRGMRDLGLDAQRDWFALRCDNHAVNTELVRAGCGAGVLQCCIADRMPELVRIPLDVPIPPMPVYLAAHEAIRRTPRIRRVWDVLAQGMHPHLMPRDRPGRAVS